MRNMRNHGQSILEYTVLVSVVVSSLLLMQVYVKRAYQGRLKQEVDTVGQQYSPGHTVSAIRTVIDTHSESQSGGNPSQSESTTVTNIDKHEQVAPFIADLQ